MELEYEVLPSDKPRSGFVVVRDGVSYLRVLGTGPQWKVMTPTASEDAGAIQVCPQQRRLIESALKFCAEKGGPPLVTADTAGREFVELGWIAQEHAQTDDEFDAECDAIFRRFFEIFDDYRPPAERSNDEMRSLHAALAPTGGDEDVYLCDGMWLASDGSVQDRGR